MMGDNSAEVVEATRRWVASLPKEPRPTAEEFREAAAWAFAILDAFAPVVGVVEHD